MRARNSDGDKTYSCGGTFTRPGFDDVDAVLKFSSSAKRGERLHARIHSDGTVESGSVAKAGYDLDLWITVALYAVMAEWIVVRSASVAAGKAEVSGVALRARSDAIGAFILLPLAAMPVAFVFSIAWAIVD